MARTADEASFWDRMARKYAAHTISDMAGYEKTLERTRGLLRSSDIVFEFGCGTGTTALRLAPDVARIVATDISGGMIAIAKEKAAAEGCNTIAFEQGGLPDAARPGSSFDAVLAFNVLHLVADRKSALADIYRLLKPGGLFISKTPCLSEMNPLIRLAVPVARFFGKAPHVEFFTSSQLEEDIASVGFAILARESHASKGKDTRPFFVAQKAG